MKKKMLAAKVFHGSSAVFESTDVLLQVLAHLDGLSQMRLRGVNSVVCGIIDTCLVKTLFIDNLTVNSNKTAKDETIAGRVASFRSTLARGCRPTKLIVRSNSSGKSALVSDIMGLARLPGLAQAYHSLTSITMPAMLLIVRTASDIKSGAPQLKELRLTKCTPSAMNASSRCQALARLADLPLFSVLDVEGSGINVQAKLTSFPETLAASCASIASLRVAGSEVAAQDIATISKLRELQYLTLDVRVLPKGMVMELQLWAKLKTLDLAMHGIDPRFLASSFPALQELCVASLSVEGVEPVRKIQLPQQLRKIIICRTSEQNMRVLRALSSNDVGIEMGLTRNWARKEGVLDLDLDLDLHVYPADTAADIAGALRCLSKNMVFAEQFGTLQIQGNTLQEGAWVSELRNLALRIPPEWGKVTLAANISAMARVSLWDVFTYPRPLRSRNDRYALRL